jgi:hypothetical protein
MSYLLALTFRDGVVHKIYCGSDITVAQSKLVELSALLDTAHVREYHFKNTSNEIVFTANLDNFMYGFIEEGQ